MKTITKKFKSFDSKRSFLESKFNKLSQKFDFIYLVSKESYFVGDRSRTIYESEHFGLDKERCLNYLLSFVVSDNIRFNEFKDEIFIYFTHDSHNYSIQLTFSSDLPF